MAKGGYQPGGGRPKGSVNRITGDVKAMVLQALDEAGGVKYLLEQARANPTSFMGLVGKVLPLTIAGDKNAPLGFTFMVEHVKADKA